MTTLKVTASGGPGSNAMSFLGRAGGLASATSWRPGSGIIDGSQLHRKGCRMDRAGRDKGARPRTSPRSTDFWVAISGGGGAGLLRPGRLPRRGQHPRKVPASRRSRRSTPSTRRRRSPVLAAATAYDDRAMLAAAQAAFPGVTVRLPWNYPPSFQLLLMPLAALPYAMAWLLWSGALYGLYALLARRIASVAHRWIVWLALGARQSAGRANRLLRTVLMSKRASSASTPIVGGILLGLMTYKPHFAVLVPFVLICAERRARRRPSPRRPAWSPLALTVLGLNWLDLSLAQGGPARGHLLVEFIGLAHHPQRHDHGQKPRPRRAPQFDPALEPSPPRRDRRLRVWRKSTDGRLRRRAGDRDPDRDALPLSYGGTDEARAYSERGRPPPTKRWKSVELASVVAASTTARRRRCHCPAALDPRLAR